MPVEQTSSGNWKADGKDFNSEAEANAHIMGVGRDRGEAAMGNAIGGAINAMNKGLSDAARAEAARRASLGAKCEAIFTEGRERAAAGDYDGALAKYDEFNKGMQKLDAGEGRNLMGQRFFNPESYDDVRFYYMAEAYAGKGDWDKAIDYYTKSIQKYRDNDKSQYLTPSLVQRAWDGERGKELFIKKTYQKAKSSLHEIGNKVFHRYEIYCKRAEAYLVKKNYDAALADCNAVFERNTSKNYVRRLTEAETAGLYQLRSTIYQAKGDKDKAAADHTEALRYGLQPTAAEIKTITASAQTGDAASMLIMGKAYEKGWGLEKSDAEMVKWYEKSGNAGDALAMRRLGDFYKKSEDNKKSKPQALAWYKKAADKGDAKAQEEYKALNKSSYGVSFLFGLLCAIGIAMLNPGRLFGWGFITFLIAVACYIVGIYAWHFRKTKLKLVLAVLVVIGFIVHAILPSPADAADAKANAAFQVGTTAVSGSDGVAIRPEASASSGFVTTLKKGDAVTITGKTVKGWTPVEHDGDKGYIETPYLKAGKK